MRVNHVHANDRGITGDINARDAARRMVPIRLKAVELLMPLALDQPEVDIENVHQLRVATRRAEAALRIFGGFFAARRVRKIQKQLKKIRRAASLARECDVFSGMISTRLKTTDPEGRPALKALRRWTKHQRRRSQKRIQRAVTTDAIQKLRERRERLLERMAEPASDETPQTFAKLAREAISDLVGEVERAKSRNLARIKNLHRLRIKSKRLRYALEIFRPCLGQQHHHEIDRMKSIQDRLGEINDVDGLIDWARTYRRAEDGEAGSPDAGGASDGPLVPTLLEERTTLMRQFTAAIAQGDLAQYPNCILDLLPPPSRETSSTASPSVDPHDVITPT